MIELDFVGIGSGSVYVIDAVLLMVPVLVGNEFGEHAPSVPSGKTLPQSTLAATVLALQGEPLFAHVPPSMHASTMRGLD